jgi:hypothetical protein
LHKAVHQLAGSHVHALKALLDQARRGNGLLEQVVQQPERGGFAGQPFRQQVAMHIPQAHNGSSRDGGLRAYLPSAA